MNNKAAAAVLAAKNAKADEYAPYEYTAASEYLKKAREEGAYAQYQVAIAYGRQAEQLGLRARAIAEQKAATGAPVPRPESVGSAAVPAPAEGAPR